MNTHSASGRAMAAIAIGSQAAEQGEARDQSDLRRSKPPDAMLDKGRNLPSASSALGEPRPSHNPQNTTADSPRRRRQQVTVRCVYPEGGPRMSVAGEPSTTVLASSASAKVILQLLFTSLTRRFAAFGVASSFLPALLHAWPGLRRSVRKSCGNRRPTDIGPVISRLADR